MSTAAAIGDGFAAVAAVAAAWGLRFARDSARAAHDAVAVAKRARVEAERERRRERLIRIGEGVERLAVLAEEVKPADPDQSRWRRETALLRQTLVGFDKNDLPKCHELAHEVGRRIDEVQTAADARREVNEAIERLEQVEP